MTVFPKEILISEIKLMLTDDYKDQARGTVVGR